MPPLSAPRAGHSSGRCKHCGAGRSSHPPWVARAAVMTITWPSQWPAASLPWAHSQLSLTQLQHTQVILLQSVICVNVGIWDERWARKLKKITGKVWIRKFEFIFTHFLLTDILSRIRVVKQLVYASVGEKRAPVPQSHAPVPELLSKLVKKCKHRPAASARDEDCAQHLS